MTRLCGCGCGAVPPLAKQSVTARGYVRGEPMYFVPGHQNRRKTPAYVVEDRGHDTRCWIWQGTTTHKGYGMTTAQRRLQPAHRVYYERVHGPIPAGLQIDHLCRVRACVNPDHMEPVTPTENTRRGNRAKLTMELVAEIRASSESTRALARRFGVHPSTLAAARNGETWVAE